MRALWSSRKSVQPATSSPATEVEQRSFFDIEPAPSRGEPLMVPIDQLDTDPYNPRTEIPQADLDEMTQDIAQRGVLQPIVVTPADVPGRYVVRLGSKRWQAARLAGLASVPATLATRPIDGYGQVAENLKRHALSPMDLARFMHGKVQAGESNAAIARHLCIDQTTVTYHLALLSLPEALDSALRSGRCTSPRTLYELSKLHDEHPERVTGLIDSDTAITRAVVATMRDTDAPAVAAHELPAVATMESAGAAESSAPKHTPASPLAQANQLCDRLDSAVTRLLKSAPVSAPDAGLAALGDRLQQIAERLQSHHV